MPRTHQHYVMDVTGEAPCFCPYNVQTGEVTTGHAVFSGRCPGKLVGIFHRDGYDAALRWAEEHRDWQKFGE